MKQENIGKLIIAGVILVIVLIGAAVGINYYFELKRQNELKSKSTEFINVWANFTDETSQGYLDSIKPYLDQSTYNDTVDSALELKKLTTEGGYEPNTSQFTITSGPSIKKNGGNYLTTTEGTRYYVGVSRYNEKVELTWTKNGSIYLISNINAAKQ